jgi:hypothetical protein
MNLATQSAKHMVNPPALRGEEIVMPTPTLCDYYERRFPEKLTA